MVSVQTLVVMLERACSHNFSRVSYK